LRHKPNIPILTVNLASFKNIAEQVSESIEPTLSKERLVYLLKQIADFEADVSSIDQLRKFLCEQQILEIFSAAIKEFGQVEEWFGDLSVGVDTNYGRFVSASISSPPALQGGSTMHIFARESDEPSFGLLLPFDKNGELDSLRTFSASSFLNKRVFYITPYETPTAAEADDEAEICATTVWVVQLAAAHLASTFEKDSWPDLAQELGIQ
jgi:hypothetical protein